MAGNWLGLVVPVVRPPDEVARLNTRLKDADCSVLISEGTFDQASEALDPDHARYAGVGMHTLLRREGR